MILNVENCTGKEAVGIFEDNIVNANPLENFRSDPIFARSLPLSHLRPSSCHFIKREVTVTDTTISRYGELGSIGDPRRSLK